MYEKTKERLMTKHTGLTLLFLLVCGTLLLSACTTTTTPGAIKSSQTPAQVLQKSQNAMKRLTSVHLGLTSSSTVQLPTTPSSSAPSSGITTMTTGNGDEKLPGQVALHLTTHVGTTGQSITLAEIVLNNKLYIQNTKGQWYVIDASKLSGNTGIPTSDNDASTVTNILALAQKATLTDHGLVTLNGQKLRHLTVTFGKDALPQLLNAGSQTQNAQTQQSTAQLLKSVQAFQAQVDFWIDESTYYVHQMDEKITLKLNRSPLGTTATTTSAGTTATSSATTTDTLIDLSKFNQPVTITVPTNAIPTTNILSIFQ